LNAPNFNVRIRSSSQAWNQALNCNQGSKVRSSLKTYALGFIALVAAVLLRWALDPLLGNEFPLVTLFGAVAAAVWIGGYRVAIPVAIAGYVACQYLFIPPRYSLDSFNTAHIVGLAA
jgi:K+-sensing histidine kinase KdpD